MFEKEAEEYVRKIRHDVINWDGTKPEERFYNEIKFEQAYLAGAEFGYNKSKEELNQNGLALQSDMDKTIEQNIALKKELNKANENDCELLKSLLYCTVKSCNNCGKVNCENFQRQRIDYCSLWVSYKDYIAKLEKENAVLKKKNSDEEIEEIRKEVSEEL